MKYRRSVSSRFKPDPFISDNGPRERWQHSGKLIEVVDPAGAVAARASEECILDVLYYQRKISLRQHRAALRLKSDYVAADLGAHVVASYNAARTQTAYFAGYCERTEHQEEAYQRWRQAMVAVGPMYNDTVMTVVCHEITPDEAHYPLLMVGLIKLAKWYGITAEDAQRALNDDVHQAAAGKVGLGCGGGRDNALHRRRFLH